MNRSTLPKMPRATGRRHFTLSLPGSPNRTTVAQLPIINTPSPIPRPQDIFDRKMRYSFSKSFNKTHEQRRDNGLQSWTRPKAHSPVMKRMNKFASQHRQLVKEDYDRKNFIRSLQEQYGVVCRTHRGQLHDQIATLYKEKYVKKQRLEAARKIQRVYRNYRTLKTDNQLQDLHNGAASRIQNWWRSYLKIKMFRTVVVRMKEKNAVIIGSRVRGWLEKKKFKLHQSQKKLNKTFDHFEEMKENLYRQCVHIIWSAWVAFRYRRRKARRRRRKQQEAQKARRPGVPKFTVAPTKADDPKLGRTGSKDLSKTMVPTSIKATPSPPGQKRGSFQENLAKNRTFTKTIERNSVILPKEAIVEENEEEQEDIKKGSTLPEDTKAIKAEGRKTLGPNMPEDSKVFITEGRKTLE